jgi:ketosteroid isomerase-like protein
MKKLIAIAMLLLCTLAFAKSDSDPKPELLAMLNNFLAAASHNPASPEDKKIFNDFFADDVIYTRAAGVLITKAEIMKSLDASPSPSEPAATYSSEDVTVHSYGDVAIVNFKLVQKLADGTSKQYRNTGTFITRNHRWQVIAWQATAIPQGATEKK